MYRVLLRQRRTLSTGSVRRKAAGKVAAAGDLNVASKKKHRYVETILLPRTQFLVHLKGKKQIERDEYLTKTCGFDELYKWQRKNLPGPDFVLHDGPPYANGVPHMGHAINKILKDITLRNNILRGRRVHYVPGWDCHGLPIELKAVSSKDVHDSLEIRQKARKYAEEAVAVQKQAFQSWGLVADWGESSCYLTNQASYMKNELRQFAKLYEKGIVFRDFMPVYWSPSSRTALAESELEYNEKHQSKSVIVRLRVDNLSAKLESFKNRTVYALTWTTVPWTLVANQALAFSADATYCIAEDDRQNLYILGEDLLKSLESKIGPLRPVARITGSELKGSTYIHPFEEKKLPFLAARHVKMNFGTGLVHIAPAHGSDDFIVALENDIRVLSMVDIEGRYTEAAGPEFHGLDVFTEGTERIFNRAATDILHVENFTHSFPYDWRTKQPVFMRASNQWFININSIRQKVVDSVDDIKMYPECNRNSFANILLAKIKERPYWCISRQRSWGTPVPALYSKKTGEIFTSGKLVERLCDSIDRYGPDCWWEHSVEELIGSDVLEELNIAANDVEKGNDILDIWFDSGVSWSAVLPEGKADLYLEGYDQFNGWFQSSLLTSVALQDCPPYRALFVHGFAVDKNCLKMSKSVGNVINPEELLLGGSNWQKSPVYGVDVLRWWVASHASQNTKVPVSKLLLDDSSQSIHRLRSILRFLLGVSNPSNQQVVNCEPQYRMIDKYMLYLLYRYNLQMQQHYDNYEYNHASRAITNFLAINVSAMYCALIKDRVYCDKAASPSRLAVVTVARETATILMRTIAPILPHLAEEVWLHHSENQASAPLHHTTYKVPETWNDPTIVEPMDAALRLRKSLLQKNTNTWNLAATIEATTNDFSLLSVLHDEEQPSTSELCEILQLSSIRLIENHAITETEVRLETIEQSLCDRCWRYPETREGGLCSRCANVLARDESTPAVAYSES